MTDFAVGEIYKGVGNRTWTITRILVDRGVAQWLEARIDGGGTVQVPLREAPKWFTERVGKVDTV